MPSWFRRWWELVDPDEREPGWRYQLIEKLDLQPNDIIVVTVQRMTAAAISHLKMQLASEFPDHQIVVLPQRSRISVLRPGANDG